MTTSIGYNPPIILRAVESIRKRNNSVLPPSTILDVYLVQYNFKKINDRSPRIFNDTSNTFSSIIPERNVRKVATRHITMPYRSSIIPTWKAPTLWASILCWKLRKILSGQWKVPMISRETFRKPLPKAKIDHFTILANWKIMPCFPTGKKLLPPPLSSLVRCHSIFEKSRVYASRKITVTERRPQKYFSRFFVDSWISALHHERMLQLVRWVAAATRDYCHSNVLRT